MKMKNWWYSLPVWGYRDTWGINSRVGIVENRMGKEVYSGSSDGQCMGITPYTPHKL